MDVLDRVRTGWLSPTLTGVACGVGAALCWAAGMAAARHGVLHGLAPVDISFHRFVWAGLFLFPLIGPGGFSDLGGVGWGRALILAVLAGPVQGILSATGFLLAPLGHGAVIQPGTAALTGFLLATLVLHEPLRLRRALGACAIVVGLMLLAAEAVTTIGRHGVAGDLVFVVAGAFWASFTIVIRLWGIRATQAVAAIGVVSLVVYAPLHALLFGFDRMLAAGIWENVLQILVQGIFAGALAIHLASRAVILLGAGRSAAFPAVVPPATLLIGFVFLGEVPTLPQLLGLCVVAIGFRLALKP